MVVVPAFGDSFTAICLLSKPASLQNSGGFDYKLYLMSKEIFFTGRIEKGTLEKTGTFSLSLSERLYQLNRKCGQAISDALPKEPAALLKAVALGDKSAMSDELKKDLSVSGLSHMTAVSGMYVTTLLSFVYIILSLLKRNKYKFFLPVCGVILLFMLFTGATPSVVRAGQPLQTVQYPTLSKPGLQWFLQTAPLCWDGKLRSVLPPCNPGQQM